LASPILASFGLVATFDPSVSLLPTMYSPANWADHRKLDSGERNELYAFGGQTGGYDPGGFTAADENCGHLDLPA